MPRKVLRYIPIIPHLQRLFKCNSLAQFIDYHTRNRSQDEIMQMPIDGSTFKEIEEKWPHFKEDSNVMLMVVDLVKGLRGGEVHRNLLMIIT